MAAVTNLFDKLANIFASRSAQARALHARPAGGVPSRVARPTPGINADKLAQLSNATAALSLASSICFSAATRASSPFSALGIMPYITSSIILQC